MSKRKYVIVAQQDRLGRVGARLLFSLVVACGAVLFKTSIVHAQSTVSAPTVHAVQA